VRTGWLHSAMAHVMESASGVSPERLARVRTEAPTTLLGDLADFPFPYVADAWQAPDLGEAFRSPIQSDVPVLFVSGSLDPRTPPRNAQEVQGGFPGSQHLIVDGLTHESPLALPRAADVITTFFTTGDTAMTRLSVPFTFEEAS
jgi:pimeloyl-ACP methyl ester carboxylesterase